LAEHPKLTAFLAHPDAGAWQFVWPDAPALSGKSGLATRVELAETIAGRERRSRLIFHGRYVTPYFDSEERIDFVRAAAALREQLGASHAGLYARCEDGRTHHLGAWFSGPDAGGAVAALTYLMGAFAEPPQIAATVLAGPALDDPWKAQVLDRLNTDKLKRDRVARLLGPHGGMVSGRPEGPGFITFPFGDGNRAARASRKILLDLGVGARP
jgi:hypothetical protein